MQSRIENEQHTNLIITDRLDSSKLIDLHVYIIPKTIWRNDQNLVENIAMKQAISVGFVRVPENLNIYDLRRYIIDVCGNESDFPQKWIYLRSVGRCLTKVKEQQEKELKVKNFRPPITLASEIYLLEQDSNDQFFEELSITSDSWIKPLKDSLLLSSSSYPYFVQYFTSIPLDSTKPNGRDLVKTREEQQRLYMLQLDLARRRQEIEDQYEKEQIAATIIQTAFRNYHHRQVIKQQKTYERESYRQNQSKNSEVKQTNDGIRLSNRLEELQIKRMKFQTHRTSIINQIHQLQTQITTQKKEEKNLWKKIYLMEKNHIIPIDEHNNHSKIVTNIDHQLERTKICLTNSTKFRQQAENELRLLRQELHEISTTLNALERYRLPKRR